MRNKQVVFGALLSYGAIAFNIISGLLYTPWMIHAIGDDQYALYTLAMSVINLFLLDFGIGSAVTKFLSGYYAKGEYDQAERFISVVYRVFFIIAAVIACCLTAFYFLIDGIYIKLTADELRVFKRLFVIVATYSVLTFPFTTFNGILMANEQFIAVKACNLLYRVTSVVLIVICLLAGSGVYALVLVHAFANVLFMAVKYVVIRRKAKTKLSVGHWDGSIAKNVVGYSAGITVISVAQRCIFNIMPSVIAALIGTAEVTMFSLAATLEGYFYTFADAINGMFMPRISRILAQEDATDRLQELMGKVGRFHIGTMGLLYVGFICVGRAFVDKWMGPGYDIIYWCALLLILPSLIDTPQQVARTALLASDVVWQQSRIYAVMAVINLVLAVVLLPLLGVLGGAIAVCVAYLVRTLGFNILYRRALSLKMSVYFKTVYGRWLPTAVAAAALSMALFHVLGLKGWSGLFISGTMVVVIYALFYLALCLNKEERHSLYKRLRK